MTKEMKETANSYRANKIHLEQQKPVSTSIQYMQINDNVKFSVFIYFQKNGGRGYSSYTSVEWPNVGKRYFVILSNLS